jgi:signal transduction histidine kinase/CheY-like chemotaxis protein
MGRAWEMRVAPKAAVWGSMRGDAPRAFLAAGLGLAAAIALLAHALLVRQVHDRERQALELELQQSRKMEAIGQLAGGVAHDFNNVLTAILVNAGLARGAMERRMQPDSFLDRILEACERATDLTTQLLTFSRKQVVEEVPVDLSEEVARQRTLVAPIIRDNVTLVQDLDPDSGVVRMHRGHVSQLMMNLLGNAVDALPDGGEIRVSTRPESRSPRGKAGRWAVLAVGDGGVGMTEDVRARVMEPFFTTKAVGKGTGLGLATVYGIATGAGGFVEIRSAPGLGTTVEVWLPVTISRPRRESTPIPARTGRFQGRVLLVEDDPAVLDAIGGLLREAGLEVVPAENGRVALDAVRHGAAFDVVVTDAVMPQMGGLALVRELRAIRPAFGAVVCSAYAGDIRTDDLKQAGAVFVAKPFTPDALLEAIRRQMVRAGVGHEATAPDGRPTPGSR